MDVATDRDLFDFSDGLDLKDTSPPATKACEKEEEKEEDVWQEIVDALNNWMQRILDSESSHRATTENGKFSRNSGRIVEEAATGWFFNSSRSDRVAICR